MSSELIAKLILQGSRIVMSDQMAALLPNNFGCLTVIADDVAHDVYLEEIGSTPGEFNIALKVESVTSLPHADVPGQTLAIEGPFGMLKYAEVIFLDEQSGELCKRFDSFLVTSQTGETIIEVDVNAVGTFVVRSVGAERRVDA